MFCFEFDCIVFVLLDMVLVVEVLLRVIGEDLNWEEFCFMFM